MSSWDELLIAATTTGLISPEFVTVGSETIVAGVLGYGEGIKIQYTHDGTVWQDLYLNGVLQEITEMHSLITLVGPGKFRVVKSITANAVSVVRWRTESR